MTETLVAKIGDPVDEPRAFPRVWPSIGWIILYFVLQIACFLVPLTAMVSRDPELAKTMTTDSANAMASPEMGVMVLWSIIASGMITLALLWWNVRKDGRAEKIGLFASSRLSLVNTLGLGAGLIIGAFVFTWVYSTYIIPGVEMQDAIKKLLESLPKDALNTAVKYLAIAAIGPIIEEVLFRGYLQNAFMARMNGHAAIWAAALVFALVHLQPEAIPALMVLGAAFGYLYHRTGSLKTNIALHMLNNAAALYFS